MFSTEKSSKLSYILAMAIFGTVGVFRKWIDLPSTVVVFFRCVIGIAFLLLTLLLHRRSAERSGGLRRNLPMLLLSGISLGMNWALLFEAYRLTSVATAILCYYMGPVIVVLLSPLLFRERLTPQKLLFTSLALLGMVFVSGILRVGFAGLAELRGVLLALGAALFYAGLIVTSKKITGVDATEKTIFQLAIAALVVLPFILLRGEFAYGRPDGRSLAMLLILGVLHTGIAYLLYVGSMEKLKAQIVALFSYIDPIVAILSSALLLREKLGIWEILGSVLILGASFLSDMTGKEKT